MIVYTAGERRCVTDVAVPRAGGEDRRERQCHAIGTRDRHCGAPARTAGAKAAERAPRGGARRVRCADYAPAPQDPLGTAAVRAPWVRISRRRS